MIKLQQHLLLFCIYVLLNACDSGSDGNTNPNSPINGDGITLQSVDFDHNSGLHISSMPIGGHLQLSAEGVKENGDIVDITSKVTWSSTNNEIASVTESGMLNTHSVGSIKVVATFGNSTLSQNIDVDEMVITIYSNTTVFLAGESATFLTIVKTVNDHRINEGEYLTWESSNPNIASIDATGAVQLNNTGETVITARFFGVTGTFNLTVVAPLVISINNTDLSSVSLSWNSIPGADYYKLSWDTVESALVNTGPVTGFVDNLSTTQYVHEGLNTDSFYRYTLEAISTANQNQEVIFTSKPTLVIMPSNNSTILSGDTIGTGEFANTAMGREIPFSIETPESRLSILRAYVSRIPDTIIALENRVAIIMEVTNSSEYSTFCQLHLNGLKLIDINGVDLTLNNAILNSAFFIGGIRMNVSTTGTPANNSQCLGPKQSGYFTTIAVFDQPTFDTINNITATHYDAFTVYIDFPISTITPLNYMVIPANAIDGTKAQLQVEVRNNGPELVTIKQYSTYFIMDSTGKAIESNVLTPIAGWTGELLPDQSNILVGVINFVGTSNSIHVVVNY